MRRVAGVLLLLTGGAAAVPLLDEPVDAAQWERLSTSAELAACQRPDCETMRALLAGLAGLAARDFPNTQARVAPPPPASEPRVVAMAHADPGQAATACRMLAALTGAAFDDVLVLHALELAARISSGCGRLAVAALPAGAPAVALLGEARALCVARRLGDCASFD